MQKLFTKACLTIFCGLIIYWITEGTPRIFATKPSVKENVQDNSDIILNVPTEKSNENFSDGLVEKNYDDNEGTGNQEVVKTKLKEYQQPSEIESNNRENIAKENQSNISTIKEYEAPASNQSSFNNYSDRPEMGTVKVIKNPEMGTSIKNYEDRPEMGTVKVIKYYNSNSQDYGSGNFRLAFWDSIPGRTWKIYVDGRFIGCSYGYWNSRPCPSAKSLIYVDVPLGLHRFEAVSDNLRHTGSIEMPLEGECHFVKL